MSHKTYNVHYSRILGVPLLRQLLYLLQNVLIRHGYQHIWVSKQASKQRDDLLKYLTEHAHHISCTAWRLGAQLSPLCGAYIFDYTGAPVSALSLEELYDVQWSIILAKSVTSRSVPLLGELLPQTVPLWTKYVISVHQRLDTQCDFVKQTIDELLRRGLPVCIYSHVPQPSAIREKYSALGVALIETSCPIHWSWLPYTVSQGIESLWQKVVERRLEQCIGAAEAVFWAFDPDDAQVLSQLPERYLVLYDCVDFYTSSNPELRKKIDHNQRELLSSADVFCVNSQTLYHIHKKTRKDLFLVPQGFDERTFQKTMHQYKKRALFQRLTEKQKTYRKTVTFAGVLSHRINYSVLYSVVQKQPKVLFCLPQTLLPWDSEDGNNWQKYIEKLKTLPNIFWYPKLQREDVLALLEMSDVGLIPYDVALPFNRYCFPMKLFEHFSVGIPTLSTPIEELKYYPNYVKVGATAEDLVTQLRLLLRTPPSQKVRREMLMLSQQHSWSKKVSAILEKLHITQHANVATRYSPQSSRLD